MKLGNVFLIFRINLTSQKSERPIRVSEKTSRNKDILGAPRTGQVSNDCLGESREGIEQAEFRIKQKPPHREIVETISAVGG